MINAVHKKKWEAIGDIEYVINGIKKWAVNGDWCKWLQWMNIYLQK